MVWSAPAFTVGGWLTGLGWTVTETSSLRVSAESPAVRRRTYVPGSLNVAVVAGPPGAAKGTMPGPLTFVHTAARTRPSGRSERESGVEGKSVDLRGRRIIKKKK